MLSAVHQMAWLNDAPLEVVRIDPVSMAHGLDAITIDQQLADDIMEYGAIANGYEEERGERLAENWAADPAVTGFEIRPQQA